MINSSTRVCSLHFTEDSYCASGRKRERKTTRTSRILKVGAVPTVFDCFPKRLQPAKEKLLPFAKQCSLSKRIVILIWLTVERMPAQFQLPVRTWTRIVLTPVQTLQCDIAYLQSERIAEQANGRELVHMLVEEKARRDFCLDRFKSDDKKIQYYTGFVTYGMFEACFNFLLPSAKEMRTWQGKRTSTSERTTDKSGPKSKLPLQEQFFMVMVWLRLGLNVEDLADRFCVSPSTVSRIFITWINLMYVKLF